MLKPSDCNVILFSMMILLCFLSSAVLACSPVAKIEYHTKADIKAVKVMRVNESSSNAFQADMLCSGDVVSVARGGQVTVKYFTKDALETELRGETSFPIFGIQSTTKLRNIHNIVAGLGKWFQHGDPDPTETMVTRSFSGPIISSPLDRSEGFLYPFLLRSDLRNLYFFWEGGSAPWRVELFGNDSVLIAVQVVLQPHVSLPVAGLVKSNDYILVVSSADGVPYKKKLIFQNAAAFKESVDHLNVIFDLLCRDSEANWRLQLWSYLQEQENSDIRTTLMDHLEKGDL